MVEDIKSNYTSLELSEKLEEAGFDKKCDQRWRCSCLGSSGIEKKHQHANQFTTQEVCEYFNCYDIMNDLCVRYRKEVFGDREVKYIRTVEFDGEEYDIEETQKASILRTSSVFSLIQRGEKQKAEDYIWEHCLFNKDRVI